MIFVKILYPHNSDIVKASRVAGAKGDRIFIRTIRKFKEDCRLDIEGKCDPLEDCRRKREMYDQQQRHGDACRQDSSG